MQLKVKRITQFAQLPRQAKEGDAGLDITLVRFEYSGDNKIVCYTGIAVEIPQGYVGLLLPRSSVVNTHLRLGNSCGVIDSGYRGELIMVFDIQPDTTQLKRFMPGDRIGQLVIIPCPGFEVVEAELTDTPRATTGFGSSGR